MARKSQRKHNGPRPAGGRYPGQQASTSGGEGAYANTKAREIEKLVAPTLSFPFIATYPSELETSDLVGGFSSSSDLEIQTTAPHQINFNHETQLQCSYAPIARSWDQQPQIQKRRYGAQNQTPISTWEHQAYVEEPFNHLEKVASDWAVPEQTEASIPRNVEERGLSNLRCKGE